MGECRVIDKLTGVSHPCEVFHHWDKVRDIIQDEHADLVSNMSLEELDAFIMETFDYTGASQSTKHMHADLALCVDSDIRVREHTRRKAEELNE